MNVSSIFTFCRFPVFLNPFTGYKFFSFIRYKLFVPFIRYKKIHRNNAEMVPMYE